MVPAKKRSLPLPGVGAVPPQFAPVPQLSSPPPPFQVKVAVIWSGMVMAFGVNDPVCGFVANGFEESEPATV